MKFFRCLLFFLSVTTLPLDSWGYFGKTNEAQSVFLWTANLHSPRNMSLEGSASALPSEDPGAALLNPAILRSSNKYQVSASWQSGDLDENEGLLFFSHPAGPALIQHTYGFVDHGTVDGYDENDNPTGVTHHPMGHMYLASFTLPLTRFNFGASGRLVWEKLSDQNNSQTAIGASLDWGLNYIPNSPRYGLAFVARNLGRQFRAYKKNGIADRTMSSNLALSGFFRPASLPRLTLTSEFDAPRYAPVITKLGGEYTLGSSLFLRAGVQRNTIDMIRLIRSTFASESAPEETGSHRLFSIGAGYQARWLTVDYSYSHLFEGMGGEHRFGLSSGF